MIFLEVFCSILLVTESLSLYLGAAASPPGMCPATPAAAGAIEKQYYDDHGDPVIHHDDTEDQHPCNPMKPRGHLCLMPLSPAQYPVYPAAINKLLLTEAWPTSMLPMLCSSTIVHTIHVPDDDAEVTQLDEDLYYSSATDNDSEHTYCRSLVLLTSVRIASSLQQITSKDGLCNDKLVEEDLVLDVETYNSNTASKTLQVLLQIYSEVRVNYNLQVIFCISTSLFVLKTKVKGPA